MEFLMLFQCFGFPGFVSIACLLAACGGGVAPTDVPVQSHAALPTVSTATQPTVASQGSPSDSVVVSPQAALPAAGPSAELPSTANGSVLASASIIAETPATTAAAVILVAGLGELLPSDPPAAVDSQSLILAAVKIAPKQTTSTLSDVCGVKDFSLVPGRSDGLRIGFNFRAAAEGVPGSEVVSNCVKLTGVATPVAVQMHRGSPISINGGPFLTGPQNVKEGDEVRVRMKAFVEPDFRNAEWIQYAGNFYTGGYVVRTANADRAPKVLQVGPTRPYKQLTEIVDVVRSGDVVEVDSGTYLPVEFKRAGGAVAPITIRGVGATRPIVNGGKWGVSFKYSDNMVFENFEVTGASEICMRMMANQVTIRNVFIHDCTRMGVLGSDGDNGSNTFDRVEIARTGGVYPGESYHHALYVATDRDQFPDAVLRVEHSYFHDNKGNSIKSRAKRAEIYYNFIDVPNIPDAFYSVELIGYDGSPVDSPINGDVAGNVIVLRKAYGIRLGGDGTGTSKGRVRLSNNTVVVSALFGEYWPVIRLDDEIDSVYLKNNAFVWEQGASTPSRLFRAGVSKWTSGQPKVFGSNNALPSKVYMDTQAPLIGIKFNSTLVSEGQIRSAVMPSINVTPIAGSVLRTVGQAQSDTPVDYDIPNPLLNLTYIALSSPPSEGSVLRKTLAARPFLGIGAPTEVAP
jgi:hypothetical protein